MAEPATQTPPAPAAQADPKPLGERSPTAEEHPTSVWICENPRCPYNGKRRKVRWQHLGGGLYLVGTVRCHCGSLPVREPRTRQ